MRGPGALDQSGLPTPDTIRKIGMMNPQLGMDFLKNNAQIQEQRALATQHASETNKNNLAQINAVNDAGLEAYEDALKSGMSPQQAAAKGQEAYTQARDALQKSGMLSPDQLNAVPSLFNPLVARGQSETYAQYQTGQNDQTRTALQAQQAQAENAYRQGMLSMDAARLGVERAHLALDEANAGGAGKPETEIAKLDADYKAGRISKDEYDSMRQKLTGISSGRSSVFNARMVGAANEATLALQNIANLPVSSNTGWFGLGGHDQPTSIMGTTAKSLKNEMSPQSVQTYNVAVAGIQRQLATLEAQGLAPQGSLTSAMNNIVFQPGDTNLTLMQKMAEIRQVITGALEPKLSDPTVSAQQKKFIQGMLGKVNEAVPYTWGDTIKLMQKQSSDPEYTMQDLMKQQGLDNAPSKTSSSGSDYSHLWGN